MAVTADSVVVELEAKIDRYNSEVREAVGKFEGGMQRIERAGRSAEGASDGLTRSVGSLRGALGPLAGVVAAVGLTSLARSLIATAGEFQRLNVQLEVATGSAAGAKVAFAAIQELAAKTPFSVQEVTKAFIALKNFGLDPSAAAIVSYGNTAGALGKTLDDVVQAVADAATGEFERLKEFGIRASAQGDKVAFTFKGVTTTVENNGRAIEGYLKRLGETNFAGGMEKQSATLGGALSNLGDTADRLAVAFGEGGFSAAVLEAVQSMTAGASGATELATELGGLAGDAITAAREIIESFGGMETSSAETVRSIRADLAGLGEAFAGAFDGLPDAVSGAAEIARDTFGEFIRNSLRELQFLQNKIAEFDQRATRGLGGEFFGAKATQSVDLVGDFDRGRAAKAAELGTAASRRVAAKLLATPIGGGAPGNGDILGTFRDAPGVGGASGSDLKKRATAQAKAEREALAAAKKEQQRIAARTDDFSDLRAENSFDVGKKLVTDGDLKLVDRLKDTLGSIEINPQVQSELDKMADTLERNAQRAADFVGDLSYGLADAVVNGKNLGDALVNSLKRAAVEAVAGGLFRLLGGALGGLFGGLLGGARANGGPVTGNTPYLVGERGPELFVPNANGNVRPAGSFGGSGGTTVYVTQSVHFDVGLESVDQRITRAAPVLLNMAKKGTIDALRDTGIGRV